jgi:hypothetical protein
VIAAPKVREVPHAAGTDPAPRRAGPAWRELLAARAHAIIACDFLAAETAPPQRLHVLALTGHGNRGLRPAGVTAQPAGARAVRQARNPATDPGDRPGTLRFPAHDRDPLLTTASGEASRAEGPPIVTASPRTPRMNAICERVTGTLRRELPDRTLIPGDRHLALVPGGYVIRYDRHRPHQPRRQRPPDIEAQSAHHGADLRSARRKPVMAGAINEYHHAA